MTALSLLTESVTGLADWLVDDPKVNEASIQLSTPGPEGEGRRTAYLRLARSGSDIGMARLTVKVGTATLYRGQLAAFWSVADGKTRRAA